MLGKLYDAFVAYYLKDKQYKNTEREFTKEAPKRPEPAPKSAKEIAGYEYLKSISAGGKLFTGDLPEHFSATFLQLKEFIEQSLEEFKGDMAAVLYPAFVYMYLYMLMLDYWTEANEFFNKFQAEFASKNKDELLILQNLQKAHLFDEGIFQKYMQNKCVVNISPYSYKLLLHFVQLRMLVILLHIFNMHIDFRITSDKWILEQHATSALLLPYTAEQLEEINKRNIAWGRLLISPEAHFLKEAMKTKKGDPSLLLATQAKIPLTNLDLQSDLVGRIYDSLERKTKLSPSNLPSIAMHTFTNTGHSLTAVDVSRDAAILVAGFSDALIRVYIQDPNFALDIETELEAKAKEEGGRKVAIGKKRELVLVGHSMAVTCLSISPTSYFLLSGSLDCTIRLWSLHTSSTLMIFKGHTFPIWDLKFAPLGYYFASASEDRTACIWRTSAGYPIRSLVGHLGDVEVIEFHPNMHYVATGSNDKTIRLYSYLLS